MVKALCLLCDKAFAVGDVRKHFVKSPSGREEYKKNGDVGQKTEVREASEEISEAQSYDN